MQFHEVANIFPMMSDAEFASLKSDIQAHGLLEPIWLHNGLIIDGRNRYQACVELGVEPHFRQWDGNGSLVAFVVSLNLHRRHLSESQRGMVAAKLANMAQGERTDLQPSANLQKVSRAEAAELLNVSERTVNAAAKVKDEGAPELAQAVETGRASVSAAAEVATLPVEEQREIVAKGEAEILKAAKEIRAKKAQANAQARAEIKAQSLPLPDGQYQCLVIDPPWPIEKIERDERPNQVGLDYPTMTLEELAALPVQDLAADDCHLYLWTTHKFLPDALKLAEAWGFRYQCLMTWIKNVGFTPFSWMYSTEHVLFCRRGSLALDKMGLRLDFHAKVREHSRKPNEFYNLVAQASPGPRLDMFSREAREGFEQWGFETERFKEIA